MSEMKLDPRDANRVPVEPTAQPAQPLSHSTTVMSSTSEAFSAHTYYYVLVPAIALCAVAVVALVIHLLVRYHRRKSSENLPPANYHYVPQEDTGWESELLDDADPPFVRDSQRPIVSLSLQTNAHSPTSAHNV